MGWNPNENFLFLSFHLEAQKLSWSKIFVFLCHKLFYYITMNRKQITTLELTYV